MTWSWWRRSASASPRPPRWRTWSTPPAADSRPHRGPVAGHQEGRPGTGGRHRGQQGGRPARAGRPWCGTGAGGRAAADASVDAAWTPPVLSCSARESTGLDTVWERLEQHRTLLDSTGRLAAKRRDQQVDWTWTMVRDELLGRLHADAAVRALARPRTTGAGRGVDGHAGRRADPGGVRRRARLNRVRGARVMRSALYAPVCRGKVRHVDGHTAEVVPTQPLISRKQVGCQCSCVYPHPCPKHRSAWPRGRCP